MWRLQYCRCVLCLRRSPAAAINITDRLHVRHRATSSAAAIRKAHRGIRRRPRWKRPRVSTAPFSPTRFRRSQTPAPFHSSPVRRARSRGSGQMNFNESDDGCPIGDVDESDGRGESNTSFTPARVALPGATAGIGGPGGFGWSRRSGGLIHAGRNRSDQCDHRRLFKRRSSTRGQASGFARWGGAISF